MKTVGKVLDTIEYFLENQQEIGIVELSKSMGTNVSSNYRILSVLVKRGYLKQTYKRGKYSLGLKLLQYGVGQKLDIVNIARPFLEKLNVATGESVNLAVSSSNEVVYVDHIHSKYLLRTFTEIGNAVPKYCSGVGKALLAHLTPKQLKDYLDNVELVPYTMNTITDPIKLKDELKIIKRRGVSIDNEERESGIRCLATPIRDAHGDVVAAISISGPATRMEDSVIRNYEPLIIKSGLEISAILGYKPN